MQDTKAKELCRIVKRLFQTREKKHHTFFFTNITSVHVFLLVAALLFDFIYHFVGTKILRRCMNCVMLQVEESEEPSGWDVDFCEELLADDILLLQQDVNSSVNANPTVKRRPSRSNIPYYVAVACTGRDKRQKKHGAGLSSSEDDSRGSDKSKDGGKKSKGRPQRSLKNKAKNSRRRSFEMQRQNSRVSSDQSLKVENSVSIQGENSNSSSALTLKREDSDSCSLPHASTQLVTSEVTSDHSYIKMEDGADATSNGSYKGGIGYASSASLFSHPSMSSVKNSRASSANSFSQPSTSSRPTCDWSGLDSWGVTVAATLCDQNGDNDAVQLETNSNDSRSKSLKVEVKDGGQSIMISDEEEEERVSDGYSRSKGLKVKPDGESIMISDAEENTVDSSRFAASQNGWNGTKDMEGDGENFDSEQKKSRRKGKRRKAPWTMKKKEHPPVGTKASPVTTAGRKRKRIDSTDRNKTSVATSCSKRRRLGHSGESSRTDGSGETQSVNHPAFYQRGDSDGASDISGSKWFEGVPQKHLFECTCGRGVYWIMIVSFLSSLLVSSISFIMQLLLWT
jgi:hypothetical protein